MIKTATARVRWEKAEEWRSSGGGAEQRLQSQLYESFLPGVKGHSLHGHDRQCSESKYLLDNELEPVSLCLSIYFFF